MDFHTPGEAEGGLREELAQITAEAGTAAEGTLASGKCLLFRGL